MCFIVVCTTVDDSLYRGTGRTICKGQDFYGTA